MRLGLVVALLLPRLAWAQDEAELPTFTKASYPWPLVERPTLLPDRMLEASLGTLVIEDPVNSSGTQYLGIVGAELGIRDVAQLGLTVSSLASPDIDFGSVRANFQAALGEGINGRIDLAFVNLFPPRVMVSSSGTDSYAFVGGVGLVLKRRLGRRVAITSGNPSPFRYDDDLLSFDVQASGWGGFFTVPLGLLIQLHRDVAFELRGGFRTTIGSARRASYVPVAGELTITPVRRIDIGLALRLPGPVDGTTQDYADIVLVQALVQMRF